LTFLIILFVVGNNAIFCAIYIENANTIPKWIKEIFASECNLENEKAIHERNNFRLTSKFQAVGNIYVHGGSVVVVIVIKYMS
jgi:hypothetical protein